MDQHHITRDLPGKTRHLTSVLSLKLLYNDNKGCHSRENGNPAEKTGFRIKSGMTFSVKSFLRQYTSGLRIINEPKNPNENGGDFRKALTSDQWMAIRRLVGYVSGSKIYWYVEAWDELNRKSEIGVMSFILMNY